MRVLLTGWQRLDFEPKDRPGERIKGYNLFMCAKASNHNVVGFVPLDNGGKRFITDNSASKLGITEKFLDENCVGFIEVSADLNGKLSSIEPIPDDESAGAM